MFFKTVRFMKVQGQACHRLEGTEECLRIRPWFLTGRGCRAGGGVQVGSMMR